MTDPSLMVQRIHYEIYTFCPISPKDDDSNTNDDTKTGIDGSMDDSDSK